MAWIVIHEARKTVYYGPFAFYTEAMDFRNKKRSLYANDGLEVDLRIEPTIEVVLEDNINNRQDELAKRYAVENAKARERNQLYDDPRNQRSASEKRAMEAAATFVLERKQQRARQAEIDAAAEVAIKGSPDAFQG